MNIKDLALTESNSVRDAMQRMDDTANRLLVIVDNDFKPIGLLSDGDIRRYLLNNGSLSDPVILAMNKDFVSASVACDAKYLISLLNEKVQKIPLYDSVGRLVSIFGSKIDKFIPIYNVDLTGNERMYINDALESTFISSTGRFINQFESTFSEFTSLPNCIAVSNGTTALDLAFTSLGLKPGDHVIAPDLTFASPINAAIRHGVDISLVDVSADSPIPTLNSYLECIRSNTKAIVIVHLYGYSFDTKALRACIPEGIRIIEDCAEAFGSYYHGKHVGSYADISTFSFFGNKTITTGEGGMIYIRDENVRLKALMLRDHGMSKQIRYWHEYVGYNFRMTNIQAAIGLAQMERCRKILASKQYIFNSYRSKLSEYGFEFFSESRTDFINSHWLVVAKSDHILSKGVDRLVSYLVEKGIDSRKLFFPLSEMKIYKAYKAYETNNSSELQKKCICLPSYPGLLEEDICYICDILIEFIKSN